MSFNPLEYTVIESAASVELQLLKSGFINIPITVTVSTLNGTAVGQLHLAEIAVG